MRKLFTLCLLVFSLFASAQWQQTGSKVRYVNGLGIPTKDTAAGVAADSSQILIRPADSSLYIKYKRTWVKVGAGGTIGGSGTTNYIPKFTASTTLGNSQLFDDGTNIGLGTTSPVTDFHISKAGSRTIRVSNTSNGTNMELGIATALGFIGTQSNNSFAINTNNVERIRITNAGDVGINQTAPAGRFVVADGQTLLGTNTNNGVDRLQVSGSAIATRLKVNTSGQTLNISTYYNGGNGNNLWVNNTEPPLTSAAENNVGIGIDAMISNTSGAFNYALGGRALQRNTTGGLNTAIGFGALEYHTTGTRNTGIGVNALNSVVSGTDNIGIGSYALQFTTGNKNVAIGSQVLYENTSGSSNIAFGLDAGRRISGGGANQTSNQSIFIGEDTRASAAGNTNEMVFGHTAIGQGSNTVTLGNSSITKTFLRGATMINTTTDNGVDELQVQGSISGIGFKQAYVTKTGAYTATNDDYVIDCTSGTFTVTLPASSGRTGRILIIKNSGAGTITVDGNAAETIDGAATYSLSVQYATVQIMSDGTNWKIIAKF